MIRLWVPMSALCLQDDASGLQRQQSELGMGLMARTGLGTAGSARSFTTPNSPTLRKLANAPIVNKIHEYVTQVRMHACTHARTISLSL